MKNSILNEEAQKYLEGLRTSENKNKLVITKAFQKVAEISNNESDWLSLTPEQQKEIKKKHQRQREQRKKLIREQRTLIQSIYTEEKKRKRESKCME